METTFYDNLCSEEKRLTELLNSIKLLKNEYSRQGNATETAVKQTPIQAVNKISPKISVEDRPYFRFIENTPETYDKNFTQIQKTIFALREVGSGVRDDIAKAMVNRDPKITLDKAIQMVGYHCSKMYRLGLIRAQKVGYKNRYALKEIMS